MQKTQVELVFVPSPGVGHLFSALEIAKLLVDRDPNLSITVLIIKFPKFESTSIDSSTSRPLDRIQFIDLPTPPTPDVESKTPMANYINSQKPHVKEAVTARLARPESPQLAGFVLDMFCASMIDVADELHVPSYIFFTSGASFLGLLFHLRHLNDELGKPIPELDKDSDIKLSVPSFQNPVPVRVLPGSLLNKEMFDFWCDIPAKYSRAKGIMVNTVSELESKAINYLSNISPPLYPVGPILNLKGKNNDEDKKSNIMKWLDGQPDSSVVFLCFGSMGSFGVDQVKEIAYALEKSGHRFLWSLRNPTSKPNSKERFVPPSDYDDFTDVLPEGFLDRTVEIGKVIGWAPQVEILAHSAIGGFVSHCGWNSILESIWFGVPIATWPLYAEQQLNAFQLLKELECAVEIKMDYRKDFANPDLTKIVSADEIEKGIVGLMEHGEVRKRVKEMSVKNRIAFMQDGSSFSSLDRFLSDVRNSM